MTLPDLAITAGNISFNTTQFEENRNFTIFANVFNIGDAEVQNALIEFFNGTASEGRKIGSATASLQPGENLTVNTSVALGIGTYNISVRLDGQDSIPELNESNNIANQSIRIPMWNYVYGIVSGEYALQNGTAAIVYKWTASENATGNVFAADIDSLISWKNLTAVGSNRTGNFTITDFEEIDKAMKSTEFEDSVNRTYATQGRAYTNGSFNVFSRIIAGVPVVNSTNTSQFQTGLLWDSSDSPTEEYNGSQDIVIVTNISGLAQGAYGSYDYEIRVPAPLRLYKGPDASTVVFYAELK